MEILFILACRVVNVGYIVEKHRRDDIYCRVGISLLDPDSISPKTHITELVSLVPYTVLIYYDY